LLLHRTRCAIRQDAAIAVRNRKTFFGEILQEVVAECENAPKVLNLACGPCRDVADALQQLGEKVRGGRFDCVDLEPRALEYAQKLTAAYTTVVDFHWYHANVIRFEPSLRFDLAWSAGLFDYLNDRRATALLRKMWEALDDGGRIVIGNFHPTNRTRSYMEWCMRWILIHRTEDDFVRICSDAGIPPTALSFRMENTGTVLFCIAQRAK
jgi:extracellular factor (EF) 3-hydroxypalmitic acid methyl ester biosynthesis protein